MIVNQIRAAQKIESDFDVHANQDLRASRDLIITRNAEIAGISTSHFRPTSYPSFQSLPNASNYASSIVNLAETTPNSFFYSDGSLWRPLTPSSWWACLQWDNTSSAVPPSAASVTIADTGGLESYATNTKVVSGWTTSGQHIETSSTGYFCLPRLKDYVDAKYLITVFSECQWFVSSGNGLGRVTCNLLDETAGTYVSTIGNNYYSSAIGYQYTFDTKFVWSPADDHRYRIGWYRASDASQDLMLRSAIVYITRLV